VLLATVSMGDPVQTDTRGAASFVETPDECIAPEICIEEYLWSLYQRTPKVDTNKVTERIKGTVKKKGKTRTVIKNHYEARRGRLHVEGPDSGTRSRHVAEGLRDRRGRGLCGL
jgi:hypothetical protein